MMIMNRVRVLVEGSLSGQKGGIPVDILIWGDSGRSCRGLAWRWRLDLPMGMCPGQSYSELNELRRRQNLSWQK